jgi:transposase-like protein
LTDIEDIAPPVRFPGIAGPLDHRPDVSSVAAADAARAALDELAENWGTRYGAVIRLWENTLNEFIPFLGLAAS